MNDAARPWIGLVFKCCALLAAIFAFIFFMRMQEEQSLTDRYRKDGTVSRAVVTAKEKDRLVTNLRKGRKQTKDIQVLSVRYNPNSALAYRDYTGSGVVPSAPPPTGDPAVDFRFDEVIWVTPDVYARTKVGDSFLVVDTPYSSDGPELIEDIRDFDPAIFYPRMVIALVLAAVFAVIGWRGPWRRRG
ncbi:hypothetical protein [Porphyrobacter sp. ULC335]|uniref:hypothetical protein n=1 Tax=Porphyrobacter sp. ULC335 TaxID=2854260 RepID=UPI00221E98BB|nr:hypothetical protein [Porphyrobacter sp. ULC335]UYV17089.1 hypothetical protein KVF90_07295 [Porphyrobacter sp. ULC335]